jgi:ribosomal protein L9
LNQAGYKRLEEGKALTKQFESFIQRLRQNPDELWAFAERVGLDPVKLAEGRLQRAVEEESMTDEQKAWKENERKIAEREAKIEAREKALQEKEMNTESERYQEKYSNDLIAALKKHGISADKQSFTSMKGIAREAVKKVTAALEKGVDMSMEDAVISARQEVDAYIQDFLMQIDDDHIISALPEAFVNRILKASLNRKPSTPTTNTVGKPVALKETGASKKGKKIPIGDYFRSLK